MRMMKKEIYNAAVRGDVAFLAEARSKDVEAAVAVYCNDDLLGLTNHGNNITHVAAKYGHLDFIKLAMESFSSVLTTHQRKLIYGSNNDGDTPLHLAAKLPTKAVAEHLIFSYQQLLLACPHNDQLATTSASSSNLWCIQNNKGNTALHVALINGGKSLQVAVYLLGVGPEVASYTNHRKETPLHLAVDYNNEGARISMKSMVNTLNGLGASLDYTKSLFEEDSLSVIEMLLQINGAACCLQDENGMTPLIRAARKSYLPAVEAIINCCSESIEINDPHGRTILHHIKLPTFFEARKFLQNPEISTLMDEQDEDGNMPLHIAIMNCDYNMVKAMMECNANFVIENEEGTSAATLIQSDSSLFLNKMKDDIRRKSIVQDEVIPKELFEAAYNKNWPYLLDRLKEAESDDKYFVSRLPNGNNIVHVAAQCCVFDSDGDYFGCSNDVVEFSSFLEEFIVEALKKYPILNCQTDYKGRTPLHWAMCFSIMKPGGRAFQIMAHHLRHMKHQPSVLHALLPWEVKDDDGNTIFHLAIMNGRYKFAKMLIELDSKLLVEINYKKETPLHILCRYGSYKKASREQELSEMVDLLVEKDDTAVYCYDADGFTPLLRACTVIKGSKSFNIAERILHHFPQSIQQFDSQSDRSVLHLMHLDPNNNGDREFSKLPHMENLLAQMDRKGNTPIHLALQQHRFGTAKLLIERISEDFSTTYCLPNKEGETVEDVLATSQVPGKFHDFLSSKTFGKQFGINKIARSIFGVRYSDMKDSMGILGVVAALLATITFTAAFTVPGGYKQTKGTPIMAKRVAFQVFMFADMVGMCSSIMVLFCLLWILDTHFTKREVSHLVDLSTGLLNLSIHATLVAFMTGVYVTTFPDVPWLPIFINVFCSIVLLLMRRDFIFYFMVPVFIRITNLCLTLRLGYCYVMCLKLWSIFRHLKLSNQARRS